MEVLSDIFEKRKNDSRWNTSYPLSPDDWKVYRVSGELSFSGYIDNKEEVQKMLNLTLDLGIHRIGFVALMPVNDFCKEHFVDINDIPFSQLPHVYFTGAKDRGVNCKCSNYLYNRDLKILEIYMRNYANPRYCESSLVFDGEYLRQGFYSDNIIY